MNPERFERVDGSKGPESLGGLVELIPAVELGARKPGRATKQLVELLGQRVSARSVLGGVENPGVKVIALASAQLGFEVHGFTVSRALEQSRARGVGPWPHPSTGSAGRGSLLCPGERLGQGFDVVSGGASHGPELEATVVGKAG